MMYTDDVIFVVVGAERLARALRCWHSVTRDLGLTMAIARKRQLGASVQWLGLDFHVPLGLVCAPPAKRMRAIGVLSNVVNGVTTSFDAYRSTVGLLEHLLPFVGCDRTWMYHMYSPFARGARATAAAIVTSPATRERCAVWRHTLARVAGAVCTSVLRLDEPVRDAAAPLYMYSDAAKEGASPESGLGGFMHGLWWSWPLEECDLDMPIVLLEFIAFAINFIVFEPWLIGVPVVARSDSLGSVQIFTRLSARTHALQAAHGLLLALPAFAAVSRTLMGVEHLYGDGNPAADMASRGRFRDLALLCAQLGVHAERVPVPAAATAFLASVRAAFRAGRVATAAVSAASIAVRGAAAGAAAIAGGLGPHRGTRRGRGGGRSLGKHIATAALLALVPKGASSAPVAHALSTPLAGTPPWPVVPNPTLDDIASLPSSGWLCANSTGVPAPQPSRCPLDSDARPIASAAAWPTIALLGAALAVLLSIAPAAVLTLGGDKRVRGARDRRRHARQHGRGPRLLAVAALLSGVSPAGAAPDLSTYADAWAAVEAALCPPSLGTRPALGGPTHGALNANIVSPLAWAAASRLTAKAQAAPPLGATACAIPSHAESVLAGVWAAASARAASARTASALAASPLGVAASAISCRAGRSLVDTLVAARDGGLVGLVATAPLVRAELAAADPAVARCAGAVALVTRFASSASAAAVASLLADKSPLALRPRNPETLIDIVTAVDTAGAEQGAASTLLKDNGAWRRWEAYCAELGTSPWRTDALANSGADDLGYRRESTLLAGFVVWVYERMMPRRRADMAPRPQSALNVVLAVRRVHKRRDIIMVSSRRVIAVVRVLLRRYVTLHGPEALLPRRKQPLHAGLLRKIRNIAAGTMIGRRPLDWTAPFFVSIWALLAVGLSAGFRKHEVSQANGTSHDKSRMSRASLVWRIAGRLIRAPTVAMLRALARTDFAMLTPMPTKNDPFGDIYGNQPIYLPWDPSEPTNAAAALVELELMFPVAADARKATPLFVTGAGLEPITHSLIDAVLRWLLLCIMSLEEAELYSVHSLRIACASALHMMGASHQQIQAFVRWQSLEAVTLYARIDPAVYGDWVRRIARAEPSPVAVAQLPALDWDDVAAGLGADGGAFADGVEHGRAEEDSAEGTDGFEFDGADGDDA
jgi:hypothetical protein